MPIIPALRRQSQGNLSVRGQPDVQSDLQDSESYTEKSHFEKSSKQKAITASQSLWHTSVTEAFGRQEDFELEASLSETMSSKPSLDTQGNPI